MKITVKDLRLAGYKVRIRHNRLYKLVYPKPKNLMITKGEMKFDEENGGNVARVLEEIRNGIKFEIDNSAGLTEVNILKDDVIIGTGQSKVASKGKDRFNKKRALEIALGRAIAHIEETQPLDLLSVHK